MTKRIMYVEGMDGQVELMADRVVIHRQGFWNALKYGMNARREIPLGAIAEVAFTPASALRFGEVEFIRAGTGSMGGGGFGLAKKKTNPNAIKFKRDKNVAFEALKEKVFEIVNQQSRQAK